MFIFHAHMTKNTCICLYDRFKQSMPLLLL